MQVVVIKEYLVERTESGCVGCEIDVQVVAQRDEELNDILVQCGGGYCK